MIDKSSFVDYLYNKLPSVYREEDHKIGDPLYRYLQCLCSGGFEKVIEDSNNFLTLIDPEKCPDEIFPYLYESFGLNYFNDIPIEYHRKFLSNLGALMKRRGTYNAIRYLVATLTGYRVDLSYERRYNDSGKCIGRFLDIVFYVDSTDTAVSVTPGVKAIEQFIQTQLPFYITPCISACIIDTPDFNANVYRKGVISYYSSSYLSPLSNI